MADIKITDLAGYSNPVSTDVLPIVDVGNDLTKKVSIADLLENAGAGSESAPAFAFDGDNDTGIYRPGANQVAISTGGTERMRIDSSGRVGIGVTSPAANLHIKAASGDTKLRLHSADSGLESLDLTWDNTNNLADLRTNAAYPITFSTNQVERMRIDSDGRLLAGTSSSSAEASLILSGSSLTNLGDAVLWLSRGAQPSTTSAGVELGKIKFGDNDQNAAIEIEGERDGGTWTSGVSHPGRLLFKTTANGATTPTERMRITSAGNVGIGTSAPVNPLHVEKSGSGLVASFRTGNANDGATIGLVNGSEAVGYLGDPSALGTGDTVNTNFAIRASQTRNITFVTGSSPTEKMRIDSSGNVGIGTTSPGNTLEVVGDYTNDGSTAHGTLNITSNNSGGAGKDGRASIGFSAPFSYLGTDTQRILYGLIEGRKENNGQGDTKGFLSFSTSPQSSSGPVERMRIDSLGRLLVGTSADSGGGLLQVRTNTSGNERRHSFRSDFSSTGYPVLLNLDRSLGNGAVVNNSYLGYLAWRGHDGTNLVFAASISGEVDGTPGTNDMPGRLVFSTTADGASSPTERMRITKAGNVGIGTSSPTSALHVYGNTPQVHCQHNTGIAGPAGFKASAAGGDSSANAAYYQMNGGSMWGQTGALGIRFGPADRSTVNMLINTNNGKVGIGTASPSATLEVIGSATFSGAVSKGSGSFRIPHPLKAETHQLVHSFVEGPQADNIYRGKVDLVAGTAAVNIDTVAGMTEGTFVALNREIQCFTTNETGWTAIKGSVTGNVLTITAQENTCTDTISWLVIGERQDQHMYDTDWTDENGKVIVEPEKPVAASEAE